MNTTTIDDEAENVTSTNQLEREEKAMLKTTTLKIVDTAIVRCQGRILVGEDFAILRNAVMKDCSAKLVVLDMAGVKRIDAGGLGLLLGLRDWTSRNGIRFKLMNVRPKVERVIKLARIHQLFEFWTVGDMFDLIHVSQVANAVGACARWLGGNAVFDPPAA